MNLRNTLIVEDQSGQREALEYALDTVVPRYNSAYTPTCRKNATCYSEASAMIERESYDLILLDHRMPIQPTGTLEKDNFDLFSAQLTNVGYHLIPKIQKKCPQTLIIGTSSLSRQELREFPAPPQTISKMWGEAEQELDAVLKKKCGEGAYGK